MNELFVNGCLLLDLSWNNSPQTHIFSVLSDEGCVDFKRSNNIVLIWAFLLLWIMKEVTVSTVLLTSSRFYLSSILWWLNCHGNIPMFHTTSLVAQTKNKLYLISTINSPINVKCLALKSRIKRKQQKTKEITFKK